jgi:hypothetical protein
MPRAWWTLSLAPGNQLFTRTGPDSIELELESGRLLESELELFCRPPGNRLPNGASIELEGMRVDVVDADGDGIRRVRFTFDAALEDPSLVFLEWKDGLLRTMTPPALGTRWTLTPPSPF